MFYWVRLFFGLGEWACEPIFQTLSFSNLIHTGEKKDDDPYAFSSQVEHVFYVKDSNNPNWHVVVRG